MDLLPAKYQDMVWQLPDAAELLLSGDENSVDVVFDLLCDLCRAFQDVPGKEDPRIANALLDNSVFRIALLKVLAVAARQPWEHCDVDGDPLQQLAMFDVSSAVFAKTLEAALDGATCPAELSAALEFARAHLRMETLHCHSMLLSAAAAYLQRVMWQGSASEAAEQPPPQLSPAARAAMTSALRFCGLAVTLTANTLDSHAHIVRLYSAIGELPRGAQYQDEELDEQESWPPAFLAEPHCARMLSYYMDELAGALYGSGILEHTSRVALLAKEALERDGVWPEGGDGATKEEELVQAAFWLQGSGSFYLSRVLWDLIKVAKQPSAAVSPAVVVQDPQPPGPAASLSAPARLQLQEVLSGTCVQYLVLSCGVAELYGVDSGPCYGMSEEVLRWARGPSFVLDRQSDLGSEGGSEGGGDGISGAADCSLRGGSDEGAASGGGGDAGDCFVGWRTDLHDFVPFVAAARSSMLACMTGLLAMGAAERSRPGAMLPRRRAAAMGLALRTARITLAAASAWAAADQGEEEEAQEEVHSGATRLQAAAATESAAVAVAPPSRAAVPEDTPASAAAAGGAPCDAGGTYGAVAGDAGAAASEPGAEPAAALRQALPRKSLGYLVLCALNSIDTLLEAAIAAGGGGDSGGCAAWAEAAACERWRIAVAAAGCDVTCRMDHCELANVAHALALTLDPLPCKDGGFPLSPPLRLAAALSAGLPAALERMLRQAGREPDGAVAVIVEHLYARRDVSLDWLLAYGQPAQAAVLVVTMGKLLRRVIARLYEKEAGAGGALGGRRAAPSTPSGGSGSSSGCGTSAGGGGRGLSGGADGDESGGDETGGGKPQGGSCPLSSLLFACSRILREASERLASAPGSGHDSAAARQLAALLSLAAAEWLPPLSRLVQRAARSLVTAERAFQPSGTFCVTWGSLLGVVGGDLLQWLHMLAPNSAAGTAAGAAGAAAAGAAAGVSDSWRALLAEEVGAVPLLGALLRVRGFRELTQHWADFDGVRRDLATAMCAAVLACPERIHRRAADGETGLSDLSYWPLPMVQGPVREVRSLGRRSDPRLVAVKGLEQVESWLKGESVRTGALAAAAGWYKEVSAARLQVLPPPGAAVCRLLRRCANPGCVNLDGDSEAEVRLMACSRCGAVGYCSRECQAAHWRAGHRAACAALRRPGDE